MALMVDVTLKGIETPFSVEIINPDRVRWDMTASKHNWPAFDKAPFLGTTFLAWAAMRRTGDYKDTFETFRDTDALNIESYETGETADTDELGKFTP